MNRAKEEWCDYSWNPVTGCMNGCSYCHSRKMTHRFSGNIKRNMLRHGKEAGGIFTLKEPFKTAEGSTIAYPFGYAPTFHEYRFGKEAVPGKLKSGFNIGVGTMAELFGTWIPDEWRKKVFDECAVYDQHNYLFMTKNPEQYKALSEKKLLPQADNYWYGITVTKGEIPEICYSEMRQENLYLCFEPLMGAIVLPYDEIKICDWIIIGGERSGRRVSKEQKTWIREIVDYADDAGIPVFMKDTLRKVLAEEDFRKEYPEALMRKTRSRKLDEKQRTSCGRCKEDKYKKEMIAVLTRSVRGEAPKQTVYICPECMKEFCREWEVKLPDLAVYQ